MAPIDTLTEDETLRLLRIIEDKDKHRNWWWLEEWLKGAFTVFGTTNEPSIPATPENVLRAYEDDKSWENWKRDE